MAKNLKAYIPYAYVIGGLVTGFLLAMLFLTRILKSMDPFTLYLSALIGSVLLIAVANISRLWRKPGELPHPAGRMLRWLCMVGGTLLFLGLAIKTL